MDLKKNGLKFSSEEIDFVPKFSDANEFQLMQKNFLPKNFKNFVSEFFFRIRVFGVGTFPDFVFGFREPPMPPLRLSRPHVLGIWTEHNSLTVKLLIDIVLQLWSSIQFGMKNWR